MQLSAVRENLRNLSCKLWSNEQILRERKRRKRKGDLKSLCFSLSVAAVDSFAMVYIAGLCS